MEAAEVFYRLEDGGLIARNVSGSAAADLELPAGATRLSKSTYERALAGVRAQRETYATDTRAADQAAKQGDYEALVALKVPEDTARRLTGYTKEAGHGHR